MEGHPALVRLFQRPFPAPIGGFSALLEFARGDPGLENASWMRGVI